MKDDSMQKKKKYPKNEEEWEREESEIKSQFGSSDENRYRMISSELFGVA